MQIQVRVSEEGVLRHQRHAFTDRYTLVTELLQNARRAGATRIDIDFDEMSGRLRVSDDGCGIEDFQTLLTFHESGWDEATRQEESPFGIGFSRCLYAATRCVVMSRGRRIDFDTRAALAREPVDVFESGVPASRAGRGTTVELHGVELPDLAGRIGALCAGFPVAVTCNGHVLDRPWAADRLALQATPIGGLWLCGTPDGWSSRDTAVFLQGLCVLRPFDPRPGRINVLHLDPRQFMARLPDRDKLIDEDEQRRRIDATLGAAWRAVLEQAKARLPAAEFVATYHAAMQAWGHLDLLNDVDVLPAAALATIGGYPCRDDCGDCDCLRPVDVVPTRDAIERGQATLVVLDDLDDDTAACWMLARARGFLVLDVRALHFGHWVFAHVRFQRGQQVRLRPKGVHARSRLDGRQARAEVVLCSSVQVTVGDDTAEIGGEGVLHGSTLYIPDGEGSGEPVRQVCDFTDEHGHFLEDDLDADRQALAGLIGRLRCADPGDALASLLRELRPERFPALHGRRFLVTVGADRGGHRVELVA
ncbi:ATP-binding protein [Azohydromonas aeria]|uniref:ATP-binding protein n=1 Tax=Azohydromonas aeria TaxID=2590212 RepID=UPI0018DFFC5E|nr:ATP-binding protein [Azohydromonas aeria]